MRTNKLQWVLSGFIFLLLMPTLGWALSGCLVSDGKKLIIDTTCVCSKKNQCATFPKASYDEKFFNSRDSNNKYLFPEKLKNSYKESYALFNKVVQLKSSGEGHSKKGETSV